ncbi:hypothetical protein AXG93_2587s1610 [Marchantia polymorpha subsp. ruderalis]|uniref:Reverse transcriptase Ty1/copia-type domain-containing protein n=1 Tax=Marchantia polymorpha subsp. ruderalis TaxID=1480154 RepID=A0A176WT13_MARPO|nr:hypothetical protein AXG93_2587s1610 [Marchantia polymorpha subsp. ruderalis]
MMKLALDGKPDKLKARLVALCFEQKAGVDFEETFAPIVKWSTVQTLVALVAQNGWKIIHLDVKTAFLNGDLRDEVFMEQPEGSHVPRQETKVYKLTRALYELCQAPRAWYEKIDTYLQSQEGFKLGVELESKPANVTFYRRIIGKQLYLTTTRPDIVYATSILSRFMSNPRKIHIDVARHVLRYLKGTQDFGILYQKGESSVVSGWTDADWTGDYESRKSTSGYLFQLGSGLIPWSSKKQPTVALSSTEAEYRSLSEGAKEAVWLQQLFKEIKSSDQIPYEKNRHNAENTHALLRRGVS